MNLKTFSQLGLLISLMALWAGLMFSKALTSIALVAAIILWVLNHWQEKNWRLSIDPKILGTLAAFFIWTVLSFFWSEAPKQSWKGITKVLGFLLIFILTADIFRQSTYLKKWEKSFLWMTLIVIIDGWFQHFTGKDFIRGFDSHASGSGNRLTACFNTYGLFAAYLISTLPLLASLAIRFWKEKQKKYSYGFIAAFTLSLPLLYLTRSRGAILAAFLGFLIFLIYKRLFLHVLALLLAAGIVISILPKNVLIHLDIERKEQSLVERWYLWDRALHVIKAKPLTGTGINTYAVAHQKYDKTQNWRVKNYYAHNGYLQMAAEIGIPGLALFLIFILRLFWAGFKNLSGWVKSAMPQGGYPLAGILVGLLNFLILMQVDTILHNPPSVKLFWYLAALSLVYAPPKNKLEAGF